MTTSVHSPRAGSAAPAGWGRGLRPLGNRGAGDACRSAAAAGRFDRGVFGPSPLCTHFGISGPVVLDASRHLLAARAEGDAAEARVDWLPDEDRDAFEGSMLSASGQTTCQGILRGRFPERLLRMLLLAGGVEATDRVRTLTRARRLEFLDVLFDHRLEVVGDRGYTFAEATAGGVPLSEIRLDTMESRIVPGLHLAGEICDVDGRVGGFNFQWAWASGFLAGRAVGRAG